MEIDLIGDFTYNQRGYVYWTSLNVLKYVINEGWITKPRNSPSEKGNSISNK